MQLYIHIPFCVKKCAYCDFLSFAAEKCDQTKYVHALIQELKIYGKRYKNREISTIFIGGGTPSCLEENLLSEIMNTVYEQFEVQPDAEITMECNPGTVTAAKFEAYKKAGINRLSIGLQSANDDELKTLGRIHTFEQFLKTYDMARRYGFNNINIDLMSSLPGQTKESFLSSLRKVIRLKPEHISAYSLIIEEGTPFYEAYQMDMKRQENGEPTEFLPSEEEVYEITKLTRDHLMKEGYHWYEISNFAKPGKECRHNIGYWKRADYLGVGLGAASLMENVRYANTSDMEVYIHSFMQAEKSPVLECEKVSRTAQMEEFMFLGLRMVDGFKRQEFYETFGVEIEGVYGEVLRSMQEEGLIRQLAGQISLTEKGVDLSNYVLAQFLLS